MLMFEKISTLQSEVDSKEIALDDMTTKYNGSNKSVKSLSDRVREVNLVIKFYLLRLFIKFFDYNFTYYC